MKKHATAKCFWTKKTIARTTTITTVTASIATATITTAYGFQHCTTTNKKQK